MNRNTNPLQQLFEEVVQECYRSGPELNDAELSSYVAGVLADFSETEHLYRIQNAQGHPLRDVTDMLIASDPVYGDAGSFERERQVRKHIGDFSLFFAGMFPESATWRHRNHQDGLRALVRVGKESYYIVSQFNVFEFEQEAPLFSRLAENFEACTYGLGLVRKELEKRRMLPAAPNAPRLLM